MIAVTVPLDVKIRGYVEILHAPPSEFVREAARRAAMDHPRVAAFHAAMREKTERAKAVRR